jgi:hypothetical protein
MQCLVLQEICWKLHVLRVSKDVSCLEWERQLAREVTLVMHVRLAITKVKQQWDFAFLVTWELTTTRQGKNLASHVLRVRIVGRMKMPN